MRVLHAQMSRSPHAGIMRQMLAEQHAAEESGLDWTVRIFVPTTYDVASAAESSSDERLFVSESNVPNSWVTFRRRFYSWLLAKQDQFDVILIRYSSYDPFQYLMLRRITKPVFLVHHTMEVPQLWLEQGFVHKLKAPLEAVIGPRALRLADGLIGVTDEVREYECGRSGLSWDRGYVYPNGFRCGERPVVEDQRGDIPKFLFVSNNFDSWHGLDLLLKAIRASDAEFRVDIVGNVYAEQRALANDESRVTFHGHLSQQALWDLAACADVGLSCFALFRKGMEEACTLKVREYLAMGLPVYAGYRDTIPESFPYFRSGACDLERMISYAMEKRSQSRQAIASAAKPHIDKKTLLKQLYLSLQTYNSNC